MSVAVSFAGVSRHFGSVRAVDAVDLDIPEGEFFAMLGPSGSGKTTCLRLIAGFEQPTSGDIRLFGQSVREVPPYRRAVNTVFQDYALFPHLNVRDNVAYGLMIAGRPKADRYREAEAALEMVALPGYGDRKPGQLSGGQRQRVALARAIVNRPKVLLLDEPLGALDLRLREAMQEELKSLQRQLGITFVFVTHDQGEALSMADRVAVFDKGRIVQVGASEDVYQRPSKPFVAAFVGSSNVLRPQDTARLGGPSRWASLRPEAIRIVAEGSGQADGKVTGIRYQGAATRVTVLTGDEVPRPDERGARDAADRGEMSVLVPAGVAVPAVGARVALAWDSAALHLMDAP